jgi:serine/threonine protein kinase
MGSLSTETESLPLLSLMPLGEGGFGRVYCTHGPVQNRLVALKVIPKGETSDSLVKDEIQIQSGLPFHENILQELYSYFAEKKEICLVLEYAPSGSLFEQERPFAAETSARRYICEVCKGLSHIHQHCIIHRDVKMENLVLGSDGRVKIIDF